jgi:hypothetical protein
MKLKEQPNNTLYIGFSRSTGGMWSRALGWLIRKFTGGKVNHAFFLYRDAYLGAWMTLGANENGVTLIPLAEFRQTREIVQTALNSRIASRGGSGGSCVTSSETLWKPVVGSLWDGVCALHDEIGVGYNFSGLVGMAGVELLRRLGVKRPINWLDDPHRLFCSEYCAEVIIRSNLPDKKLCDQIRILRPATIDPALLASLIAASSAFAPTSLPAEIQNKSPTLRGKRI